MSWLRCSSSPNLTALRAVTKHPSNLPLSAPATAACISRVPCHNACDHGQRCGVASLHTIPTPGDILGNSGLPSYNKNARGRSRGTVSLHSSACQSQNHISRQPPHRHYDGWKRETRSLLHTSARSYHPFKMSGDPPSSSEIRSTFLRYFQDPNDHVFVPSSSVIPYGDPTLLFTNAGMNQFKDIFQGTVHPSMVQNCYRRVVNSQKCIRVGGKHNDLDDVGRDHTHHTFFEMLGNWSFGDFFKKEACTMALDLLTSVYGLPKENLYFTYFEGNEEQQLQPDDETKEIWLELGIPRQRVLPFGMADNFWEMGSVGPCGPCTEIHMDRHGNRDASHLVNRDDPGVVEIWNLVFMQFYRDHFGHLHPLHKNHVDTGMGLERLVSIVQGVNSNYDTDLFRPLIQALEKSSNVRPYQGLVGAEDEDYIDTAYRAIADHVRMLTVSIADGCRPDSQKRGYVLKRVVRRAVRYASEKLQLPPGNLSTLVPLVVQSLGNTYPELEENPQYIADLLDREEEQFLKTLQKGEKYLKKALATLASKDVLPGDIAWRMYDAYGFPLDLTTLIANEQGLDVDTEGFEKSQAESREITSQGGIKNRQLLSSIKLETNDIKHLDEKAVRVTDDSYKYNYHHDNHGKYDFQSIHAHVLGLKTTGGFVDRVTSGQECGIVLDRTTFYAEQGGQEWDEGCFMSVDDKEMVFAVSDVQSYGGYVLHHGTAAESIAIGDHVMLYINEERREKLMRNHTGTHIVNFALRRVLGEATEQKGSLVAADRFRFDFNAEKALSDSALQQVSTIANELISQSLPVHRESLPLETALSISGVRTVAGETYPDPVSVLCVGCYDNEAGDELGVDKSLELCGGTHVDNTSHIRRLVIISEKLVSKGIRRLTVVTGSDITTPDYTANKFQERLNLIETQVQNLLMPSSLVTRQEVMVAMDEFVQDVEEAYIDVWKKREMNRRIAELQTRMKKESKLGKKALVKKISERLHQQLSSAEDLKCIVEHTADGIDNKGLVRIQQAVEADYPSLPMMLLSTDKDKAYCVCYVPKEIAAGGLHANQWLDHVIQELDGKGFGSDTFARGRGTVPESLDQCLKRARSFTIQHLDVDS